ncbi:hypothetical protein [Altererythrobacter lutimaris]|uniref:hypothetical protein n=1 Tax=Altererythrobacter lutimaris TaxID=2743979 RepID=UPI00159341E8|nr:hypothetical protein [Altererythrobacter lutimaris]
MGLVLTLPAFALNRSKQAAERTFPIEGRCAHDVERLLTSKERLRANVMGFNTASLIDPNAKQHLQGIARFEAGGKQFLFVSQSSKRGEGGLLATVEMGSRGEGRWRSNRQFFINGRASFYTAPHAADRVVAVKRDESFADYFHPGGLAIHRNILAVGMEGAHNESTHARGRVDLYRIQSPTSLKLINSVPNSGQLAAAVAFTRLSSGAYLFAVPDNSPKNIRFYRSVGTAELDEETRFEHVAVFSEADLRPGDNNYFQNVDFVTDCASGRLYMVLAFQDHDWLGLWQKNRIARYEIRDPDGDLNLRHLGRQKVDCSPHLAGKVCDFDASFGAYVTSEGKLIYYASEHANTGPGGSVSLAEIVP